MSTVDYIRRPGTARVTVPTTVTRTPGRRQAWTASAGDSGRHVGHTWHADGNTERAATDALADMLGAFLTHYRTPVVQSFRGYVAILSVDVQADGQVGWWQEIVGPNTRSTSCHRHTDSDGDGWAVAEARGWWTLAQVTTAWYDDESVHDGATQLIGNEKLAGGQYGPVEFYRYAAWQRAAQHALAQGMGDAFYDWATEHAHEFAIPQPD